LSEEQKRLAKEEIAKKELEEKKQQTIEQLEREIKSINKGVDFSTYRGTIDALQIELVLFGTWANIITDNENSEDPKIKSLVKQLRPKVARLQIKEFPIMRKEYAKVVSSK
jgi:Zn-dependent oligopeptidase